MTAVVYSLQGMRAIYTLASWYTHGAAQSPAWCSRLEGLSITRSL